MAGFMKKLFRGMETSAEEKKEAKALKSGSISKKQYVAGEKAEGHGAGAAKKAAAIKSGKLSPSAYAKGEQKEKAMKCGGKAKKMAIGGVSNMPTQAVAGIARRPAMSTQAGSGNAGGAMRGLDRAAAMSGRTMPATGRPMAKGGGVEAKGKTKGKTVKMAKGGGVEVKGKTKGRMV